MWYESIYWHSLNKENGIEMWGDGEQPYSFLYIDESLEAMGQLMDSNFIGPVNVGSEEMVNYQSISSNGYENTREKENH